MANNQNLGFEHRFAFGASPHTFDVNSQRFEVVSSSVRKRREILDAAGVLGTRDYRTDRARQGVYRVDGTLELEPSPRMLDFFLPYILGAAESTDLFSCADSLSGFDMLHDPFGTGANASKFVELYVNRMSLRFGPGVLRMSLDLVGKTVSTGQTYTSAALNSTSGLEAPYIFQDSMSGGTSAVTIQATAIEIIDGELVIDNALDVQFRNSPTAMSIRAMDRRVTLRVNVPLTATNLGVFFGDKSAADATLALANGTVTTTFAFQNLQNGDDGPQMNGKGEVALTLDSQARSDSGGASLAVTVVGGSL